MGLGSQGQGCARLHTANANCVIGRNKASVAELATVDASPGTVLTCFSSQLLELMTDFTPMPYCTAHTPPMQAVAPLHRCLNDDLGRETLNTSDKRAVETMIMCSPCPAGLPSSCTVPFQWCRQIRQVGQPEGTVVGKAHASQCSASAG
jgi:hypothetical protein